MRKEPRQARSRATTDAMLDAAAHILGDRGWTGLTTNAVAEIAGVSIGSLYQYFPNKLALIEAVRRRHFDEVLVVLRAAADDRMTRRKRVEALVDGMIAVHSRYPAAHRVLLEESPRGADTRGAHDRFEVECRKGYETLSRATRLMCVSVRKYLQARSLARCTRRRGKGRLDRRSCGKNSTLLLAHISGAADPDN
jgi:AcrR family transcriptional regulator